MFETTHSFVFFSLLTSAALVLTLSALFIAIVVRARKPRRLSTKAVKPVQPTKRMVRRRRRA